MKALGATDERDLMEAATAKTRPRFEDLPDVLTPRDLMNYLPIGRDAVYSALHSGNIRSVRVGQKLICTKAALREFLDGAVE
jgi:excisionase family DNA binding protein